MPESTHPVLFYDGVCGLCNRVVQFVLRRDHRGVFRFAPLQGALAATMLSRHGVSARELDTFYIVTDPSFAREPLLDRSDAVLFMLAELGPGWAVAGRILGLIPRPLRNAFYNLVARNRYRIFGKFDACPLPDPSHRDRFLDL